MKKAKKPPVKKPKLLDFICNKIGCNLQEFAELLGMSPAAVNKWLYTDSLPNWSTLSKISYKTGTAFAEICDYFGVEI